MNCLPASFGPMKTNYLHSFLCPLVFFFSSLFYALFQSLRRLLTCFLAFKPTFICSQFCPLTLVSSLPIALSQAALCIQCQWEGYRASYRVLPSPEHIHVDWVDFVCGYREAKSRPILWEIILTIYRSKQQETNNLISCIIPQITHL